MKFCDAALVGADTLRGEEIRKSGLPIAEFYGSPGSEDALLVTSSEGAGVIQPFNETMLGGHSLIIDAADTPSMSEDNFLDEKATYIYAGSGKYPERSAPLDARYPFEPGGSYHLLHPALFVLQECIPSSLMAELKVISLACYLGASFRSREARDQLASETISILELGPEGSDHYAFNVKQPEEKGDGLKMDLRSLINQDAVAMVWEMGIPVFHGMVLNVGTVAPYAKSYDVVYRNIKKMIPRGDPSNLYVSVRDEKLLPSTVVKDGKLLTFTLFADEILHGIIPNLEALLT